MAAAKKKRKPKPTAAQRREYAAGVAAAAIAVTVLDKHRAETLGTPTAVWKKILMEVAKRVWRKCREMERARRRR